MNSPLLDKSLDFATQIVLFYEEFSKSKKDTTIAKQLLRSATSIGANINEAVYGNSILHLITVRVQSHTQNYLRYLFCNP
ncbi:MAG: four helix bundle protein [Ruminococcaceae bacterium]|nr:four helix bundle protein [Oscillospiraceae bacterium]